MYELFGIDPAQWVCTHLRANEWEGFYRLRAEDGHRKVKLWQTRAIFKRVLDGLMEQQLAEWLKQHTKPLAAGRIRRLGKAEGPNVNIVWGFWDAHIGMHAWNQEVREDFSLGIAVNRCKNSVDDMVRRLEGKRIEAIHSPVGNDFMHFDSVRNTTTFGTHHLDCDSRYAKVYVAGLEVLIYMVERALQIADRVVLYYVPGNHDYTTAFTMIAALNQRFIQEPRVEVRMGAEPNKVITFGTTFIGLDHGNNVRDRMYETLFSSNPDTKQAWAMATWKEVQIGHTHQRKEHMFKGVTPCNGFLVRTNPSLSNVDYWHHSQALTGEPVKSVEAWEYEDHGYVGSHVTWARDDERPQG
ncbi:MAG: hypothetical protein B7733_12980 [Myxococcales bacterium FL481]|nr:MAG: hypothetical protein B7733_12980 [Myxococcales bacterium FL481]